MDQVFSGVKNEMDAKIVQALPANVFKFYQ